MRIEKARNVSTAETDATILCCVLNSDRANRSHSACHSFISIRTFVHSNGGFGWCAVCSHVCMSVWYVGRAAATAVAPHHTHGLAIRMRLPNDIRYIACVFVFVCISNIHASSSIESRCSTYL